MSHAKASEYLGIKMPQKTQYCPENDTDSHQACKQLSAKYF